METTKKSAKSAQGADKQELTKELSKEQFARAIQMDMQSAIGFLNYARNTPAVIDMMAEHAYNMQKNARNAAKAAQTPQ